jgi:hypothetical protein
VDRQKDQCHAGQKLMSPHCPVHADPGRDDPEAAGEDECDHDDGQRNESECRGERIPPVLRRHPAKCCDGERCQDDNDIGSDEHPGCHESLRLTVTLRPMDRHK